MVIGAKLCRPLLIHCTYFCHHLGVAFIDFKRLTKNPCNITKAQNLHIMKSPAIYQVGFLQWEEQARELKQAGEKA